MTVQELQQIAETLPPGALIALPREAILALVEAPQVVPEDQTQGTTPNGHDDCLLTAREVAARLGTSVRYVYEHADRFPFTRRLGSRTVRFSERGLERWLARR